METVKGPDSKEQRIEHMVTLYQLPLLRLCVMYLHDEEQAKDAVQETFIKAYRNLDSFRAESSERTWLIRIAINTCKNAGHDGRNACTGRPRRPGTDSGDHEPSDQTARGRAALLAARNDL